jgi:hypothetical protein
MIYRNGWGKNAREAGSEIVESIRRNLWLTNVHLLLTGRRSKSFDPSATTVHVGSREVETARFNRTSAVALSYAVLACIFHVGRPKWTSSLTMPILSDNFAN